MQEKFIAIQQARTECFIRRVQEDIYAETIQLDAEYALSREPVRFADRMTLEYKKIREGEIWGRSWENGWFHLQGTVPESWQGKEVVLLLQLSGEAMLFDENGVPRCGFSGGSVFAPAYQKNRFFFCHAQGGEKADFWVEACASYLYGLGVDRDPALDAAQPGGRVDAAVKKIRLAVFRRNVWELLLDVLALQGVMTAFPEDDYRRKKIVCALDDALSLYCGNPANADKCRESLRKILSYPAVMSALTAHTVGHAHIDVGWLWPVRESIRKAARTFSSQLRLMEIYPEYIFGASQAQLYSFVKEHYPELFQEIKAQVKAGRWEVQGGMWVEADCNLISGESMVRQFLHGKNFFMDEFGIDVKNLWLPDVFGYSAAMPQIIKKAGCDYFLTQKISWSQINKFPHNTFMWQGIDGSKVLTHFPPENTYNSQLNPSSLIAAQNRFSENGTLDGFMVLFGVGDGGGGPAEEMLEMAKRQQNWEFTPQVKCARADKFFGELSEKSEKLAQWSGELYLEFHRGTLTSQARTKRGNRQCEQMLAAVEFILSHLDMSEYPQKEVDKCWKKLLLNQFHDIIPGSSIREVYEQAEADYADILKVCRDLLDQNARKLFAADENALVLVNTLSTPYNKCIELPQDWAGYTISGSNGKTVEIQKEGEKLVAAVNLPGSSFTTLYKGNAAIPDCCQPDGMNTLVLENDLIRYEFSESGRLISAWDKVLNKEFIAGQGNVLTLYHDRPNRYEAWDVDIYYPKEAVEVLNAAQIRKAVQGKLRSILEITFQTASSTIKQQVVLEKSTRRLDFITDADWHEARKMLRTSFEVEVYANEAQYDIQYGYIKRPTHDNTSWDMARFEACGHKYADLSTAQYGAALLNDCKYGYKVKGNTIDLALLRSPKSPDFEADQGKHRFTYSFYPHAGDAVNGGVLAESCAVNRPPVMLPGYRAGAMTPICRIESEKDAVTLEVLKKAEKENVLIIRLTETRGENSQAELCFPAGSVKSLEETDLMEWESKSTLAVKENKASVTLAPFEIKNYFLRGK